MFQIKLMLTETSVDDSMWYVDRYLGHFDNIKVLEQEITPTGDVRLTLAIEAEKEAIEEIENIMSEWLEKSRRRQAMLGLPLPGDLIWWNIYLVDKI